MSTSEHRPRLRPSGGYRELRSFRAATLIYDATVLFCQRFLSSRSRTVDQMVQAARSGRQNIAEGSRAAAISSQTELRLVNVARASLDELLLDYEDFLRQRTLPQWTKDHPHALRVRALSAVQNDSKDPKDPKDPTDPTDPTDRSDLSQPTQRFGPYAPWLTHVDPAVVANALLCLIHQANTLLDRQISALEQAFVHEGGYTEQLAAARCATRRNRAQEDPTDRSDRSDRSDNLPSRPPPRCPECGGQMVCRTARRGPWPGSCFWGCSTFPACRAVLAME
ncbi:MAG: four helix bundle suffix domain-containing protein [Myxococcota bacterium]|nr:four helix bundle suffix domain-containing protein [Myxococcota bacterium]